MIKLNKDSTNHFVVNVSTNRTSTASKYLFELKFDMTQQKIYFLSTNTSIYQDRYDSFNVVFVDNIEDESPEESIVYYSTGYGNYGSYTVYEYNGSIEEIDLSYIVKTLEIGKFKVDFVSASDFTVSNSVATITADNQFYIAPTVEECCTTAHKQIILLNVEDWVYNDNKDLWEHLGTFTDYTGDYTFSYKSLNSNYNLGLSALNSSQNSFTTDNEELILGQMILNYPTLPTEIIEIEIIHSDYQTMFI